MDNLIVQTKYGAVRGMMDGDSVLFKAVPYAKPPVGELRFHSPVEPEPWEDVRDCTKAHGVEKCRLCAEFPCEKIGDMLNSTAEYRERSFALCSPEEFSLLEKAFFQKEINLKK